MTRLMRGAMLLLAVLMAPLAQAHEMSMAELQVFQLGRGEFQFHWSAGEKSQPAASMQPQWPANCRAEDDALHCGEDGLEGTVTINGVGQKFSAVLLKIHWNDGQTRAYTLTSSQPSVRLFGSADDGRGLGEIASAYTVLGIEHILNGIDHLMFVVGLLFLVGFNRRLVLTITAFTVAHSLTLASSALGLLTLRSPPVEATIALSIMLVAGEALRERETLARRWPALVAFLFGLVHGLGFAGALKDIGLPENHLPIALLTFNVGVEIGQLFTVAMAWIVYRTVRRLPIVPQARVATLYVIGTMAAFWSCSRIVTMLG
jgi:hydrogenase/urease accessory protein HupE